MADRLGWNPWRALRERSHIVFSLRELPDPLGGGVYWPRGDRAAVVLDPRLTRAERNAALAHELVHDELGAKESAVNDEVARRLVPLEELAQLVASICDDGRAVEAWEIAEAFDVPDYVARRACRLLRRQRSA